MRVYISLDAEGCSGLSRFSQVNYGEAEYACGCERMAVDVNAVIEGAVLGGASEIVVCDGHENGRNVGISSLPPAVRLYCGGGGAYSMMSGIEEGFDAAFFVGYHMRRGQMGLMAHTYFMHSVLNVRIGGVEVGEFGINAALAGYFGVPAVFVSGDAGMALEARALAPGIHAAAVKTCEEGTASCLSSAHSLSLLRETAQTAVSGAKDIPPVVLPPEMEVDCLHAGQAAMGSMVPGVERQGCTLRFKSGNYAQCFRTMISVMYMMDAFKA